MCEYFLFSNIGRAIRHITSCATKRLLKSRQSHPVALVVHEVDEEHRGQQQGLVLGLQLGASDKVHHEPVEVRGALPAEAEPLLGDGGHADAGVGRHGKLHVGAGADVAARAADLVRPATSRILNFLNAVVFFVKKYLGNYFEF